MGVIQKISADIPFSCSTPSISGIEQAVMLINFFDIDRLNTQINSKQTEITKLVLKEGKRGYIFEGKKRIFNGSQKAIIDKSGRNTFENQIDLRIFNVNPENIEQVNKLVNGVFVAILQTKNKNYEVLGFDSGLTLESLSRNYNQNEATILFSLKTNEVKEPKPFYFWKEENYNNTFNRFWSRFTTARIFDYSFDTTFQ